MIKYKVTGEIIVERNIDKVSFRNFEQTFENINPIESRKTAFNYLDNLLHILEIDANKSFQDLFVSDLKFQLNIDSKIVEIPKYDNIGFQVFAFFENEVHCIHFFGNYQNSKVDEIAIGLFEEFEYYSNHKLDLSEQKTTITYYNKGEWEDGYTEDEPTTFDILKTPFDFVDKKTELWWMNKEAKINFVKENLAEYQNQNNIEIGEGNQIEFKPSLLYNFKTQTAGIGIKYIIAKVICSFLNSNGGKLYIGVSDNKQVIGLEHDFSLSKIDDKYDYFKQQFDDTIKQFLTFTVIPNIKTDFYKQDNKDYFVVTVKPSERPIFIKGQEGKEFWVRAETSTRQITDIEEIINYYRSKWK